MRTISEKDLLILEAIESIEDVSLEDDEGLLEDFEKEENPGKQPAKNRSVRKDPEPVLKQPISKPAVSKPAVKPQQAAPKPQQASSRPTQVAKPAVPASPKSSRPPIQAPKTTQAASPRQKPATTTQPTQHSSDPRLQKLNTMEAILKRQMETITERAKVHLIGATVSYQSRKYIQQAISLQQKIF